MIRVFCEESDISAALVQQEGGSVADEDSEKARPLETKGAPDSKTAATEPNAPATGQQSANGQNGARQSDGAKREARPAHGRTGLKSGLAYAATVTLFLLLAKTFFEYSILGHQIELTTFAAFTGGLTHAPEKNRLDVVVLDIGGGTSAGDFGEFGLSEGFDVKHPTNRGRLKEIIDALADANAKAVAVDIDFSPDGGSFIDRAHDPDFFDHCLQVRAGMPVFLGVFRTRNFPSRNWLALPKYASLAVDLASTPGSSEAFTETHRFLVVPGREKQLPSLAYALASRYGHPLPGLPADWLTPFLLPTEEGSELGEGQLVNYSKVYALHTQRSIALTRAAILGTKADFEGRIVILGDDSGPHVAGDSINWPFGLSFPRVLYHASAFYTLTKAPLYEFNFWTRNVLDVLFAIPFFVIVFLRSRYEKADGEAQWRKVEKRAMWISLAFIFFAGVLLVFALHVMWLDFLLVMAALALHPHLNEWIESRLGPLVSHSGT
jgi:hypothetical protein